MHSILGVLFLSWLLLTCELMAENVLSHQYTEISLIRSYVASVNRLLLKFDIPTELDPASQTNCSLRLD